MREPQIGTVFDSRYLLRRKIAKGGMCVVFAGEHLYTGRHLAVKVLHAQLAQSEPARQRLLREARALQLSHHPHVVEILDAGVSVDGVPYLVMEMLDGRTLDGILIARGRLSARETIRFGCQICEAIAAVHRKGVIHRDVKPSNIIVVRDPNGRESAKLIDFNIATIEPQSTGPIEKKITKIGELLGTPEYMAPEQIMLKDGVDHRADLYSLAVTLYECLTGQLPHVGDYGTIIVKLNTQTPIPMRQLRADVPERLAAAIDIGMSIDPQLRFPHAREFRAALCDAMDSMQESEPPGGSSHREQGPPSDGLTVQQRRRYAREPYVTPVRVEFPDGTTSDGRSEDISEGGLLVVLSRSHADCHDRDTVLVRFSLPISGQVVKVPATTRWVRDAHSKAMLGVEFNMITDEQRTEIAQFVQVMLSANEKVRLSGRAMASDTLDDLR